MKHSLTLCCLFAVTACQQQQSEQALEQLNKKAAREVTLKTVTRGDSVLHITAQHIWYNGEQIAAKSDTIVTAITPNTWDSSDSSISLSSVPIYVTVQ